MARFGVAGQEALYKCAFGEDAAKEIGEFEGYEKDVAIGTGTQHAGCEQVTHEA